MGPARLIDMVLRALRFVPLVGAWATIWWFSDQPRAQIPEALIFPHSDKLLHFCAYSVVGALGAFAARDLAWGFVLGSLYGMVDELHQSFTPGRDASLLDWLADAGGAMLGAVLAARLHQGVNQWALQRRGTAPPPTTPYRSVHD